MTIDRVRIPITGTGVVGNAYLNMYFTAATATNLTAIRTFFEAIKSYLPSATTYTYPSGGDQVDEKTGKLTGNWTAAAPAATTGTSPVIEAAPCGIMVRWRCPAVVDGHRPVGRTLFVPAGSTGFGSNGNITGAAVSAFNSAGIAFLTSSSGFIVWHRPVYTGKPPNRVQVRDGAIAVPNVVDTSPKTVVLTSRRD